MQIVLGARIAGVVAATSFGLGLALSTPASASWMVPAAKKGALLYVSDYLSSTVSEFTYPAGKLVRTLTGFDRPEGMCVDAAGDVFITDGGADAIYEYAHGRTKPIATLSDLYYTPVSCSIDPTTGNLAVANILFFREGIQGNVVIYAHARGTPAYFSAENLYSYYFLGYDNKGNLFVDGTNAVSNGKFEYAELPHGQPTMKSLTLSGASIASPGNVQWDGQHIAVGDQDNAVIYQTVGRHIVGSTPLSGSSDVVGYFIDGGTVICPDAGNGSVELFNYPAGGAITGTSDGFKEPLGAVVSRI